MLCCAQPCADKHVHCALHVGWENEYHYLSCVSECQGEGLCVSVISCVLLYSVCLCSGLQILKDCCKLHTHHELVVATVMNSWNSHSTTNTYTTSGPPFCLTLLTHCLVAYTLYYAYVHVCMYIIIHMNINYVCRSRGGITAERTLVVNDYFSKLILYI